MQKKNPVSVRSKGYLVKSLLELMSEKPYKKISIKEITERADLSRMTFYTNFDNKEDILTYYVNTLLQKYIANLELYGEPNEYDFAYEYFRFWLENKKFLRLLKDNNLMILIKLLEKSLDELSIRFLFGYQEEWFGIYRIIFLAGGLWNLLDYWVEKGFKESPEEMANIFMKVSNLEEDD